MNNITKLLFVTLLLCTTILSPLAAFGQTQVNDVEVRLGATLKAYLGHYELVKDLIKDHQDEHGKFVFVAMRNVDKPSSPIIGFVESNSNVSAAKLKNSKRIEVKLSADEKHLVITYFDHNDKAFATSTLSSL